MAHRNLFALVLASALVACGEGRPAGADLAALALHDDGADAAVARVPTILAAAAPAIPPAAAPFVEIGDRAFVALGSAEGFVGDAPRDELAPVLVAPYRTAVTIALPGALLPHFSAWARGPITVLDRSGATCTVPAGDVRVMSTDEAPAEALEVDCVEGPYDACLARSLAAEPLERLWTRGAKSFVIELPALGACREPALATRAGAAAPEVARHLDVGLVPAGWIELAERHPAYLENQRRHRGESLSVGEIAEARAPWVELAELAQAFHFEGDPHAYVLVHYVPWCGADREPLALLLRQPLGEGEPELTALGPGFEPLAARDLIRRGEALEFSGWLHQEAVGFVDVTGETRTTFETRGSGCGC